MTAEKMHGTCRFCSQWGINTLSFKARTEATLRGEAHPCDHHSPASFRGSQTCNYFDEVKLHD